MLEQCRMKSSGILHQSVYTLETTTATGKLSEAMRSILRSSHLLFLPILTGAVELIALVDSGSQVNLITADLLPHCKYEMLPNRKVHIRGIGPSVTGSMKEVIIRMHLLDGQSLKGHFIVIESPITVVLVGMPLLRQARATVDVESATLTTPFGVVPLWTSGRRGTVLAERRGQGYESYAIEQECAVTQEEFRQTALDATKDKVDEAISQVTANIRQSPEFVSRLRSHLRAYADLWVEGRRGEVRGVSHRITLTTSRPITSKPRHYTEQQNEIIRAEISKMLDDHVIVPSKSAYSSEIVMVLKKTGDWRMCIDYRPLNRYTVDDRHPLPTIRELLRTIRQSTTFFSLDLRSGYWQIPMDPGSRDKTAFRCCAGLYEFLVMPFGLKTAPATFQRSMDFLFNDLYNKGVSCYIDDLLIHDADPHRALDKLVLVLERLRQAGLSINLQKCTFAQKQLLYLGHVITEGRLMPNPRKIEALTRIKKPTTVKEVRSIMGSLNYFQSYIPDFARHMVPVSDLLRGRSTDNQRRVEWTDDCQSALTTVVEELRKALLHIPPDDAQLIIRCDASAYAVGGALLAVIDGVERPMEFVSSKLSDTQLRWPTREKEAWAVIYCLKKFDHFVKSRHIIVKTDHQSLKWLFEAKTGKIARWASLLCEYDIEIHHIKGRDNEIADMLSRQVEYPDPVEDYMVYTAYFDFVPMPTLEEIKAQQDPLQVHWGRGFSNQDGTIFYRAKIFVPSSLRLAVIEACHLRPPLCHPGIKRTANLVLKMFCWPNLHQDVSDYVSACLVCQRLRGSPATVPLHSHDPRQGPFSTVYTDLWKARFGDEQYTVHTMIEPTTRWAEAAVLAAHTGEDIARSLLQNWICRFGCPLYLVSDNEKCFTAEPVRKLLADIGCTHVTTVVYHPQGNAPIEVFHKNLNKSFSGPVVNTSLDFTTNLALALYSYRATLQLDRMRSPACVLMGYDPRPPLAAPNQWPGENARLAGMLEIRNNIIDRLVALRAMQAEERDDGPAVVELHDLVVVSTTSYEKQLEHKLDHTAMKLVPRWSLPYRVMRISRNGARLVVQSLVTWQSRIVHISQVKRVKPPQTDRQLHDWLNQICNSSGWSGLPCKRSQLYHELTRPQDKRLRGSSKGP